MPSKGVRSRSCNSQAIPMEVRGVVVDRNPTASTCDGTQMRPGSACLSRSQVLHDTSTYLLDELTLLEKSGGGANGIGAFLDETVAFLSVVRTDAVDSSAPSNRDQQQEVQTRYRRLTDRCTQTTVAPSRYPIHIKTIHTSHAGREGKEKKRTYCTPRLHQPRSTFTWP